MASTVETEEKNKGLKMKLDIIVIIFVRCG
jgi:hypothetical protein